MDPIEKLIRDMGVSQKYKGYFFAADAVRIHMANPHQPMWVTKEIYPRIAEKYHLTPEGVERAIRTVVEIAWNEHRESLERIAGCELSDRPTNS